MEFYEAVERRRTARQFLQKEVDFEAVKRILEAGNRAPTWDHNRSWQYILLRTDEEKEYAFAEAKKIAEKFDEDVRLCHAAAVFHAQKRAVRRHPRMQGETAAGGGRLAPQSLCHHLVRDRKYPFGGGRAAGAYSRYMPICGGRLFAARADPQYSPH